MLSRYKSKTSKQKANPLFSSLVTSFIVTLFSVNALATGSTNTTKTLAEGEPQVVAITTKAGEDFILWADYYEGDKQAGGAIVLHDCQYDRHYYNTLAKRIAEQGLHTLSVDLRGYGESTSPEFSREMAKKKAQDIVSFQSEMALITANWSADLLATYQFLREKIDKKQGVSIVSSGCSSPYAVILAEQTHLNGMVMVTPQMNFSDKERYKNLIDIPSYFITSSHHLDSFSVAQELFNWNGDKQSKMQVLKGTRYDHRLISGQKSLISDIALWLKLIQ